MVDALWRAAETTHLSEWATVFIRETCVTLA